jgi:hypothetical protein
MRQRAGLWEAAVTARCGLALPWWVRVRAPDCLSKRRLVAWAMSPGGPTPTQCGEQWQHAISISLEIGREGSEGDDSRVANDSIVPALGFTLAHDAIDTAIVGTKNPDHVRANIELVEHALPIPEEVVEELRQRYDELVDGWRQQG